MPRRTRRQRGPNTARSRRKIHTDRSDGVMDAGEPGATLKGDSSSRSDNETEARADNSPRRHSTAEVGGQDIDSERPAKFARNSPQSERSSSDEEVDHSLEGERVQNEIVAHLQPHSAGSTQSADGHALHENDIVDNVENGIDDDDVSEAAKETIEAEMTTRTVSQTSPMKIKRPKGWHLRKENRHLRQALLQGSPARSERQDSIDTQDINGYEPASILKRLPGRRRVPHPDPRIEADMRRQLELKIAYRAVVKALKPVLIELAERTEKQVEEDENMHKEYDAFDVIVSELDQRFATRLAMINCRQQQEEARLERDYIARRKIRENRLLTNADDCLDNALARCQHQYMALLRESQQVQDDEATDDEDGLIPRPWGQHFIDGDRKALHKRRVSRCEWYVENDRLWASLQDRHQFSKQQTSHAPESLDQRPKGFAVYDGQLRAEASAHLNLLTLLDANDELQARRTRAIPNDEATGLQALASAMDIMSDMRDPNVFTASATGFENIQSPSSSHSQPAAILPHINIGHENPSRYHRPQPEQQYAPIVKREDAAAEHSAAPPRAAAQPPGQPTLEIVGSVSHGSDRKDTSATERPVSSDRHRRPHDEPRNRRKALTFDIIMHQPEPPSLQQDRSFDDGRLQAEPSREPRDPVLEEVTRAVRRPERYENVMGPPQPQHHTHGHESAYPPHPTSIPRGHIRAFSHEAPRHEQFSTMHTYPLEPREETFEQRGHPGLESSGQPAAPYPTENSAPSRKASPAPPDYPTPGRSARSHPATPATINRLPYASNTWHASQHSIAPKPRATSYPEALHTMQPSSRPISPVHRFSSVAEGRPPHPPQQTPAALPAQPTIIDGYHRYETDAHGTILQGRPTYTYAPNSSRFEFPPHPHDRYGPWEDVRCRSGASETAQKHRRSDSYAYGSRSQPAYGALPPPAPPPHPPPPPGGQLPPRGREQSMHQHPGQSIGQQLLPSTLDPNRNMPPYTTTSQVSHHRKQRSSSGSARSWKITTTPQQTPPTTHRRQINQAPPQTMYAAQGPPPHLPPHHRQHAEISHWQGAEAQNAPPPPSTAHQTTYRSGEAGGYPPHPLATEEANLETGSIGSKGHSRDVSGQKPSRPGRSEARLH